MSSSVTSPKFPSLICSAEDIGPILAPLPKSFAQMAPCHADLSKYKIDINQYLTPTELEIDQIMEQIEKESRELAVNYRIASERQKENRYPDVLPYDQNLFTVPGKVGYYYNCSPIEIEDSRYIAAQGPMNHQSKAFWDMVIHSKAEVIVAGTDTACFSYWEPSNLHPDIRYHSDEITAEDGPHFLIKRTFYYQDRKITQFQVTQWVDKGVPDLKLFNTLLEQMNSERSDLSAPIVVHCSAGCGRTGVIIIGDIIKQALDRNVSHLNIAEFILQARRQRRMMVQTKVQLKFLYAFAKSLLQDKTPTTKKSRLALIDSDQA